MTTGISMLQDCKKRLQKSACGRIVTNDYSQMSLKALINNLNVIILMLWNLHIVEFSYLNVVNIQKLYNDAVRTIHWQTMQHLYCTVPVHWLPLTLLSNRFRSCANAIGHLVPMLLSTSVLRYKLSHCVCGWIGRDRGRVG